MWIVLSLSTSFYLSKFSNLLFKILYCEKQPTRLMTDQKDKIYLSIIVFDENNQKKKSWSCLRQTCSISLMLISPNFFWFCWLSLIALGEFTFWKLVKNQLFGQKFFVVQLTTFYNHQVYEQLIFQKKSHLYIVGRPMREKLVAICLQLAQNWNVSTKVWQNLLFSSTLATILRCYAERNW